MKKLSSKSTLFPLKVEVPAAIARLLEERAKERKRLEAKGETDDQWYARACYITASDVENEVRDEARRRSGTYRVAIRGLGGIDLLSHCRDYLASYPGLTCHNFGKGHISGMRYRPANLPISAAEKRTMEAKTKEKPKHFRVPGTHADKLACSFVKSEKQLKRKGWGRPNRRLLNATTDVEAVTCPRCRKLLDSTVTLLRVTDEESVNWKKPEGDNPEEIGTVTLAELVEREAWNYKGADRLRGRFVYNSLEAFVIEEEK